MHLAELPVKRLIKGHWIAEVLPGIGNAAAVEADKPRLLRQPFDFVEHFLARKNTEVALMVARTDAFLGHHDLPLHFPLA